MHAGKTHVSLVLLATFLAACSGAQSTAPEAPVAETTSTASAAAAATEEKPAAPGPTAIAKTPYGMVDGQPAELYTLKNQRGMVMKVTTYGAIITELHVPDKNGKLADVVLGFDDVDGYVAGSPYFGATVGRVGNRIRGAKFTLEGAKYTLEANDPPHHLHGGKKGWDKVLWKAEPSESPEGPQIRLTYVSKDGEEGYPGTVTAMTTYRLTNDNELQVDMEATSDKTTIINMVHHSYWNLGGHDSGTILDHELTLYADQYTPGDPMVPTGVMKPVQGTPFDFRAPKVIGKDLKAAGGKPIGFDHNFVVNGDATAMRPAARLRDPKSGRVLTIEANQPGIQFYSGNFLDGTKAGKGGKAYAQYTGLCLETQRFPNAINVPAWKDQVVLKAGQTYKHSMLHRFTNE